MKVPLLDLVAQHQTIREDVMAAVTRVFDTQQFVMGAEVADFEREVGEYCHAKHAIGCASGSDALLLALMALGVGAGDEVITTSFTFFATASAVTRLGARPVFVDIAYNDFNLNVELLERAITPRTKAIMPVHLFGQCARMDVIAAIAAKHNLPIVEDAAQAIGAEFQSQPAGKMGAIGCFSFFPSKNLGGAGDGGLMTTEDDELAGKLRILRVHGMEPKYYHQVVGINSRLDALQAAVLRVKLRHLDDWSEARRANAARYNQWFAAAGIEEIVLPKAHTDSRHIYNQYTIRCQRRDELKAHLQAAGVGSEVYYPVPLHLQECFAFLGGKLGDLPETEQAMRECLSLPIYAELTADQQQYVVEKIAEFYRV
ncbi:MAG: DegT/DnrJ/EryC1/StrS family aminotransferase [Acidobacteriota bacterium]|nr:DegT/DnrJ/EryC1/StrS family aminotransferase [Acidobacteriota bacterium]